MTKNPITTPKKYPVCVHAECPKAGGCLHRLAFEKLRGEQKTMCLLNPDHCTANDSCPHFRSSKPDRYAVGFKNFQKHMYPEQYSRFAASCIKYFGRNPYYDRRRGVIPISPEDQELLYYCLDKIGVTEKLEFDKYIDIINWRD